MNLEQTIQANVATALNEDIGSADLTALLLPQDKMATATILCREEAVICGQAWFNEVFKQVDPDCQITWAVAEGDFVPANTILCHVSGKARSLLTAERSALNFVQLLSATATLTKHYTEAIKPYSAKVMDTRKTIPGLRLAQKYAVKVGGGWNQRIGLYDGILIKENHILAAGSIALALKQAYAVASENTSIQIEVETLAELEQALEAGAKLVLLDNMSLEDMRTAVALTGERAELEASGGVDLNSIPEIAATGVHRISIGKLTKDIQAIDLSMRLLG